MKKLSLLLIVAMLIVPAYGCKNAKPTPVQDTEATVTLVGYEALELGGYDNLDGGTHAAEYMLSGIKVGTSYQDVTAPAEAVVTFQGQTYSGTYSQSSVHKPNLYVSHQYTGNGALFEINGSTGQLTSILIIQELAQQATISESACRQVADAIADDYITLSGYQVERTTRDYYENKLYSYTYYREVNGYRTSDRMTVAVDGNGTLISFDMYMLGAFATSQTVVYDRQMADAALQTKLTAIYSGYPVQKNHEVDDVMLVRLEDGSCGFLYTVSNEFVIDEEGSLGSLVQILLKPVMQTQTE